MMAPNLYDAPSENPLEALMQVRCHSPPSSSLHCPFSLTSPPPSLTQTQQFTKFLSELLRHYIHHYYKRVRSQSVVGPLEHALSDSSGSQVGEVGSEISADSEVRASGSQHLLARQDISTWPLPGGGAGSTFLSPPPSPTPRHSGRHGNRLQATVLCAVGAGYDG